jgi:hypothetical protein
VHTVRARSKRNIGPAIHENARPKRPYAHHRPPRKLQQIPRTKVLLANLDVIDAPRRGRFDAVEQRFNTTNGPAIR